MKTRFKAGDRVDVLITDAPAVSPVAAAAREAQVDFVHVRSEES